MQGVVSSGTISVTASALTTIVQLINSGGTSAGFTLNGGKFDLNNQNFQSGFFSTGSAGTVKAVNMGSGTWAITGVGGTNGGNTWNPGLASGLTSANFACGTSTIELNATTSGLTAKTFAGNGYTYFNVKVDGSPGCDTLTVSGSNSFNQFSIQPDASVTFTSSTTQTLTNAPAWFGTSGHPITINKSGVAAGIVSYSGSPPVMCDWLSLTGNTASGTTPFYAGPNSIDGGGNTNWTFGLPPSLFAALQPVRKVPFPQALPTRSNAYFPIQITATPTPTPTEGYVVKSVLAPPPVFLQSDFIEPVPTPTPTPSPTTDNDLVVGQPLIPITAFPSSETVFVPVDTGLASTARSALTIQIPPVRSSFIWNGETSVDPVWTAFLIKTKAPVGQIVRTASAVIVINPLGQIKYWNGSAWIAKPIYIWNGTSWVEKPLYYFDGAEWVITSY